MEAGFLFLLFVFVFIIFIILLGFKSTAVFNQRMIIKKIDELRNEVNKLKAISVQYQPIVVKKEEKIIPVKHEEPVINQITEPVKPVIEIKKEPVIQEVTKAEKLISEPVTETIYQNQKVETKPIQPKKNTDFEKFIGENLYKLGIIAFIVILIFFGKYAVDEGWLNQTAKVTSIVLIGGVLIGLAHRLRKDYRAFSSVLAGAGIAALYISVAVGFQLYGLFSQTAAFALLVVITILAVLLALAYDKIELAIIAIFGGFATPILVSTGAGNYKILFTYILILDIGMLVLAYFKKWNLVNLVANFSTVLLYSIWVSDAYFNKHNLPYQGAMLFVSAFYLVFFCMNMINNVKENKKFTAFEFIMLITNTFLYYWAGMFIINLWNSEYAGLYTTSLAIFNFAFAFPLYRRKQIDKNLVFLLIGLVLTFISIAIPVQLKGNYITICWAAESVILLWLSQKSGIKLMKLASFIVSFIMIISLIMDWEQIYFNQIEGVKALPIILNRGFITSIISILSMLINIQLLKNDSDLQNSKSLPPKAFSTIFSVFFIISLYITFLLEIGYQVDISYGNSGLTAVAIAFYTYFYIAAILIWSSLKKIKYILYGVTIIGILSMIVYASGVAPEYRSVIDYYLMGETTNHFAALHFLSLLFVLAISFYTWYAVKLIFKDNEILSNIMLWFSMILGVIILSQELDYMVIMASVTNYNDTVSVIDKNHLIGWPILWGAIAFISIIVGMRNNERMLRIIGISLFFFTLLRFFIVDFMDMPAGGRIVAGASISVLVIVASFTYLKANKRLLAEEKAKNEENNENELTN